MQELKKDFSEFCSWLKIEPYMASVKIQDYKKDKLVRFKVQNFEIIVFMLQVVRVVDTKSEGQEITIVIKDFEALKVWLLGFVSMT